MVTWLFLTCVHLPRSMHWAYAVLGSGGYWGWDLPWKTPASFPWLTGTAFLHSGHDAGKARHDEGLERVLAHLFHIHALDPRGTLPLTRPASYHVPCTPFAQSSIGNWFTTFLVIIFVV